MEKIHVLKPGKKNKQTIWVFLANVPECHREKSKEPLAALRPQVADACVSRKGLNLLRILAK